MTELPALTPQISVVICTWNRSRLLRKTLEQMTLLDIAPETRWELIVVNNNCSDDTETVLDDFQARLPLVRLLEPIPGKSHAANRAVREAKAGYIVWTDDDVLVDPQWLNAYLAAFAQWPDASVFAGLIDPWFEESPPRWLEQVFASVAGAYAALDYGPTGFAMTGDTPPFGANMALKRSAHLLEEYDARLGPRPNSGLRGEETTMVRRLLGSGHTGRWVPEARVRHYIPPERTRVAYLDEWFQGWGEFLGLMEPNDIGGPHAFGRPLWLWKEAFIFALSYRFSRVFQSPAKWILQLQKANIARGRLRTYTPNLNTFRARPTEAPIGSGAS
jgi:glycosyltransferase involved in cell wall biosynthesis